MKKQSNPVPNMPKPPPPPPPPNRDVPMYAVKGVPDLFSLKSLFRKMGMPLGPNPFTTDFKYGLDSKSLHDLLAVLHGDGGHHTEKVGVAQSIRDAIKQHHELVTMCEDKS